MTDPASSYTTAADSAERDRAEAERFVALLLELEERLGAWKMRGHAARLAKANVRASLRRARELLAENTQ